MTLGELLDNLPVRLVRGDRSVHITGMAEDSRRIEPGFLFIARAGMKHDGRMFIPDAVKLGAAAVLCDEGLVVPNEVAVLTATDLPRCAALLAERFCGEPSRALRLVGITGTNGKTTSTYLLQQILAAAEGDLAPCGMIGTVEVDDGVQRRPSALTTPPAIELSQMLARMVENGCRAAVMEVSSHALEQQRVAALDFDVAVFTNLSGDHLDYHGSVERYAASKARLFSMLGAGGSAIVNADDDRAGLMVAACPGMILRCSLVDETADCFAAVLDATIGHTEARFSGPWGAFELRLPLCGRHNVMNALQAVAAAHQLGLKADCIRRRLASCAAPPGRLQPVTQPGDPFAVYVDYAHTDDALENVLRALRPLVPAQTHEGNAGSGRLTVVFGCGGDRDRTKRPRMAAAAWRYADRVIVTSDNPRTEDPQAIIDEILAGVPQSKLDRTAAIESREDAIREAVAEAGPGDIVLIAGKGHEDYQIIGETRRPFDDRVIAASALREARSGAADQVRGAISA